MVGNWLYGVARRTALKARTARDRKRLREKPLPDIAAPGPVSDDRLEELFPYLDRALGGLPEKYRVTVILCELEGKSHREAAEELGWPIGTVSGRLSRAKILLAKRMIWRGMPLTSGLVTSLLALDAKAADLSIRSIRSVAQRAIEFEAGQAGVIPAKVAALAKEVLMNMAIHKLKLAAAVLLVPIGVAVIGVAILHAAPANEPRKVAQVKTSPTAQEVPIVRNFEHGEQILGVALSPDGKMLATAGNGSGAKVKLWSASTGERLQTMDGAWVGWHSVAFSPDGKRLAGVGDGRMPAKHGGGEPFRLWDTATGERIWTAPDVEPATVFSAVAFSPDGNFLAVGGLGGGVGAKNGVLRLHDSGTGKLVKSIPGLDDVWALSFSPDGKALAVASQTDGIISLFDTVNWILTKSIPAGRPTSLAFSPDGRTLAVGTMSIHDPKGTVILIDLDGKAADRFLARQPESVLSVTFSPDGRHLATGGYDKTARVYDIESGVLERLHTMPRWVHSVAFSPDGVFLAAGSSPDAILWNWRADAMPVDGGKPNAMLPAAPEGK
jgi:WD40 repeat protein